MTARMFVGRARVSDVQRLEHGAAHCIGSPVRATAALLLVIFPLRRLLAMR